MEVRPRPPLESAGIEVLGKESAAGLRCSVSPNRVPVPAFGADATVRITTDAVQVFGGYGYMKDYPASS